MNPESDRLLCCVVYCVLLACYLHIPIAGAGANIYSVASSGYIGELAGFIGGLKEYGGGYQLFFVLFTVY